MTRFPIPLNATAAKSPSSGAQYIAFAKNQPTPLPVRCVYVSATMDESMARNKKRDNPVPRIVYSVYNKNFEMPTVEEGCEVVIV